MGRSPQASSWMLSRLQKVVLPELLGPVMSTRRGMRRAISSAICTIFFSCSASLT